RRTQCKANISSGPTALTLACCKPVPYAVFHEAFVPFLPVGRGIFARETDDPTTHALPNQISGMMVPSLMRSKHLHKIREPIQQVWRLRSACTAAHILLQSPAHALLRI
ncbi:MAG: hypothetical protein P8M25_16665, partial [Paracoccaceae bacterium]|nr:hypothetical protein [Paracoccaceae bacterium]